MRGVNGKTVKVMGEITHTDSQGDRRVVSRERVARAIATRARRVGRDDIGGAVFGKAGSPKAENPENLKASLH